jgi:hypothetical protein
MTSRSLRALLANLIDYAGLYPPAALSMQDAVRNYAAYREGEHAWMLGRFVVPAERVGEVPEDFPITVVGRPAERGDVFEIKASTPEAIESIASELAGAVVYIETTDLSLIPAIAPHGLRAKIRTGGVTADAFPNVSAIAAFMRACRDAGVAFKATAGLHHPMRCVKPLTYEPNAPTGQMHGFLNVFMAAALLDHAEQVLAENDPAAFSFDDDAASWRGHRVSVADLLSMRRDFAHSFGSCSFEEPIADLQSIKLL